MSTPVQKLFDLTGQFALVTGGSRGLGLQTVSYTHLTLPTKRIV